MNVAYAKNIEDNKMRNKCNNIKFKFKEFGKLVEMDKK